MPLQSTVNKMQLETHKDFRSDTRVGLGMEET